MKRAILLFSYLLLSKGAFGSEKIWTNANGNNLWGDPLNWSPTGAPQAQDSVITDFGDELIIAGTLTVNIKHLILLGELSLEVGGVLNITDGYLFMNGEVINFGDIIIEDSPSYGIYHAPIVNGPDPFYNYGNVEIINPDGIGLFISSGQTWVNQPNGSVIIDGASEASLTMDGDIQNAGTLAMRNSQIALGMVLNADAFFLNFECAKVVVLDEIEVATNVDFENYGFFKLVYDNQIYWETELKNFGIVEDDNDVILINSLDNQGILVKPIERILIKLDEPTILNFVENIPDDVTASDVFLDANQTILAGTYDLLTDTWTPNSNAVGDSIFFIAFSMDNGFCTDLVKFTTENKVADINYWIGGTGSWFSASNWSHGLIPFANDTAALFNSTDTVIIPISIAAQVKKLFIKGHLLIQDFASLEINIPNAATGIELEKGSIENKGSLILNDGRTAIKLDSSTLINNGNIYCNASSYSINSTGSLISNNGLIQSDSTSAFLLFGSQLNNYNLIDINFSSTSFSKTGFFGDTLNNFGDISIDGKGTGLGLLGYFHNKPNATISINNIVEAAAVSGINEGLIVIDSCEYGVTVADMDLRGGPFTNKASGAIEINNCESAIVVHAYTSKGHFENFGGITIDNAVLIGIRNYGGDFENMDQGKVTIKRSKSGIWLSEENIKFNNKDSAQISLFDIEDYGIRVEGSEFKNTEAASILIDGVQLNGIEVDEYDNSGTMSYGVFTNKAKIFIGPNVAGIGIKTFPFCTFNNGNCFGTLTSYRPLNILGSFNNQGLVKHYSQLNSVFNGNFNNTGVVLDKNRKMPNPMSWNEGIYFTEFLGQHSDEDSIQNLMLVYPSMTQDISIDSLWYLDPNFNQVAGKYVNNEFLPNSNAIDSSRFFFQIRFNDCTPSERDTLFFEFENPIGRVCSNIKWIGGTDLWQDAENWDKRKPGPCDSVLIELATDTLLLNNSDSAEIKFLENNGVLAIALNSKLSINEGINIGIQNFGKIVNEGILNIENCNGTGYNGNVGSELINKNIMSLMNISQKGLRLEGLARNENGASLFMENIIEDAILLKSGGYFDLRGMVNFLGN